MSYDRNDFSCFARFSYDFLRALYERTGTVYDADVFRFAGVVRFFADAVGSDQKRCAGRDFAQTLNGSDSAFRNLRYDFFVMD